MPNACEVMMLSIARGILDAIHRVAADAARTGRLTDGVIEVLAAKG